MKKKKCVQTLAGWAESQTPSKDPKYDHSKFETLRPSTTYYSLNNSSQYCLALNTSQTPVKSIISYHAADVLLSLDATNSVKLADAPCTVLFPPGTERDASSCSSALTIGPVCTCVCVRACVCGLEDTVLRWHGWCGHTHFHQRVCVCSWQYVCSEFWVQRLIMTSLISCFQTAAVGVCLKKGAVH